MKKLKELLLSIMDFNSLSLSFNGINYLIYYFYFSVFLKKKIYMLI